MLTIFTIPKPFVGHIGVIQRNALRSWTRIASQVLLFGSEPGVAEAAAEFEVEHVPEIEMNPFGTPIVTAAFEVADGIARHETLMYANADLIFFDDLPRAVETVDAKRSRYLVVGQTWDVPVDDELNLEEDDLRGALRARATTMGELRRHDAIDFFVFKRGTIGRLPPFAVGRPTWDNWMIWRARRLGLAVIDITRHTIVIHQRHEYGHVREARGDKWEGPEADTNRALVRRRQVFSLDNASHDLTPAGQLTARIRPLHRLREELALRNWPRSADFVLRTTYRLSSKWQPNRP